MSNWYVEGGDYAEDGREIFDDNDEDEEQYDLRPKAKNKVSSQSAPKKKRLNPDIRASDSAPLRPSVGRDIRSLFAASSGSNSSKKRKEMKESSVDPNLDDLLAELESSVTEPKPHHHNSDNLSRKSFVASKRNSGVHGNVVNTPSTLKRRSPERPEQPIHTINGPRLKLPLVSEKKHSSQTPLDQRSRNPFSCRELAETEQKIEHSKPQGAEGTTIHN
ncbi:unnamed protein product [Schistosoma curassoni]|uniref:RAD51_interact domain-containing protein n=1 Tax=Schistosoma curassoni TaxID=6186 RepID=A0A183L010_9TREM|nr:unnamed protein product [Schistosoma curassoni]